MGLVRLRKKIGFRFFSLGLNKKHLTDAQVKTFEELIEAHARDIMPCLEADHYNMGMRWALKELKKIVHPPTPNSRV